MKTRASSFFVIALAVVAASLAAPACSGSDTAQVNSASASSGAGVTPGDFWCVCNDGVTVYDVDGDPNPMCEASCDAVGGVKGYYPRETAIGKPECDAFCAKVSPLMCGDCNEDFFCQVKYGSCMEATLALLDCQAKMGTFQCGADGAGWSVSSQCPTFEDTCP